MFSEPDFILNISDTTPLISINQQQLKQNVHYEVPQTSIYMATYIDWFIFSYR